MLVELQRQEMGLITGMAPAPPSPAAGDGVDATARRMRRGRRTSMAGRC